MGTNQNNNLKKTESYKYRLDPEFIAQRPVDNRAESNLMVLNTDEHTISHKHFYNIIDYLDKNDVLVFNIARVFPARLLGVKSETGAKIEILVIENIINNRWKIFIKPFKRIKKNTEVVFNNKLLMNIAHKLDSGEAEADFFSIDHTPLPRDQFLNIIHDIGNIPLPPYIKSKINDTERYQTVYSKIANSSAAPTAGLHFTRELIAEILKKGVKIIEIELAVGPGTFQPVKTLEITAHKMHEEEYFISKKSADLLNKYHGKKRIICVGTTSLRALESNYRKHKQFKSERTRTGLFIYPGQKIYSTDALITNFHLPGSTLLMLVSAFAGYDFIMKAYQEAISAKYRFFSFGDAMFIY